MKKIYIMTAVLALLTLSLNAQSQTTKKWVRNTASVKAPNRADGDLSVTVANGTTMREDVPVYGWWYDAVQKNQMIYSSDLLGIPDGAQITSITFYPGTYSGSWSSTSGINFHEGKVKLSLGTTSSTSFGSTYLNDNVTQVYEVVPSANSSLTEWTLTFTQPFTYEGGNLLVQVDTEAGTYGSAYFLGENQSSATSLYSYNSNIYTASFLPKATFTYAGNAPKIEVSPETLTISDSGSNNTFTVQGSNLGTDNVGVTVPTGSEFSTTTTDQNWGFVNNNGSVSGTVTVTYGGRALSATETVTVANNLTSAAVTVTYKPNLYIYCDNGASPWDFSANPAVAMTNQGNGIYTATLSNIPANSHILFGRASGLTYGWEGDDNRLFIGASTDGADWSYGDNTTGNLDTDPTDDSPVKYHPIYFSESGTYTITIDANANTFTIDKLVLPPPTNVAATADGTTATVTWNEPNLPGVIVTEGFEDTSKFPSFSLGGITATQHYGSVGGWTLYDSTGATVWGDENDDFENEAEPQAWMVFNATSVGVPAYSGVQYMESICPLTSAAAPADSWLISPKLSGNAQTITFYERALSDQYGNESYEVWASSTDNDPASFTLIKSFTDNTLEWTQRSASLPAGTKYFAIRHTSNDIFGICVDDVTYEAASELQPTSYNIYLDGELVGNVDANTFSYDFSNVSTGNHECAVSAVYEGGESALVPATFSTLPKTATPTINVVTNADGSKTITATGDGTVHLYIDGVEQSNPYTIMPSIDGDITVTVTATAQEEGKLISDPATQTVTVAEAGRSPMPTITWTDNGDGTYTITAIGTGEVNLYINDAEHGGSAGTPIATGQGRVSITVEQHSQVMTIPVQATNQEEGLAVSRPAEATYTIPAMSLDGFTALDPQPANTSAPIDMSNLMFVDRFSKVIPATNDHPFLYDYYLQENQVRQRTSNSVEVPVKHTGSNGLGFYSLNEIDNDVNIGIDHDKGLQMDVRNAAMDLPLEADPGIYFYTEQRGTAEHPNQADRKLLAVLQRTTDGTYSETLDPSYDHGKVYPGGQHHIHLDTDTVTGDYNSYLAYVPIVWTMGFDRVNYEADHIHNSYGAPRWKTGVADVRIENLNAERQNGYMGSTNWMDGTDSVSMYMLTLDAIGTMPTVNTMPYEPYMFRVFVESKNGKLRGYKHVGEDVYNDGSHFEGDGTGPLTGPICVWSEYVKNSDRISVNGLEYTFHKEKESEYNNPEHPDHWIAPDEVNIMFAALNKLETEGEGDLEHIKTDELNVYVRFYYIVAGSADNHKIPGSANTLALRADGDGEAPAPGEGDAPAGYGTESPGTPPNPTTSVKEMRYHGEVVSTTYVNAQGMQSDKPFKGVNIVVTRYTDGTTSTTKVVR